MNFFYHDDLGRVQQLIESWQTTKPTKLLRSRLQSSKPNQRELNRVPNLTRNYNTVEQNIFAVAKLNKTISHICTSPKARKQTFQSSSVDEGFYQFPSSSQTKQENQMAVEKIHQQFQIFKQKRINTKQAKFSLQQKNTQSFYNKLSQSIEYTNEQDEKAQTIDNNNYLVNKKTVVIDGFRFPYKLQLMNNSRQKIINSMKNSNESTLMSISNVQDFEELKKKGSLSYQIEVKTEQKAKQKQELLSRNHMKNALYSLMALDKQSQHNVKQKYQTFLPKDSRFYLIN